MDNPSKRIIEALNESEIKGNNIKGIILPVSYQKVLNIISEQISKYKPNLALGVGLAPGRSKISLEKIAINYIYSREPDNENVIIRGKNIDPKGPDGIFTNIPVEEIVEYLNKLGIPAELSISAGSYLCNMAMYAILKEVKKYGGLGGFIHVPCHEECSASMSKPIPSMNLNTMITAIKKIIEFLT